MQFLKRLKASKSNLLGPDFHSAPVVELDLSGTKLSFRAPDQTADIPATTFASRYNLYENEGYFQWDNMKGMAQMIFKSGWVFYGGMKDGPMAGVILQLIIQRKNIKTLDNESLFFDSNLKKWILMTTQDASEKTNSEIKQAKLESGLSLDEARDFERYPKEGTDVKLSQLGQSHWLSYEVGYPDQPKNIFWSTAISDEHVLNIQFRPSTYSISHNDPQANFYQAVDKLIHDFMDNCTIQLSADAENCRSLTQQK